MTKKTKGPNRLYRSRYNRKIAGVCGGIGDYFDVDPLWIRLLFVFVLLAGGSSLIVYLIMWILTPLEPEKTKSRKSF